MHAQSNFGSVLRLQRSEPPVSQLSVSLCVCLCILSSCDAACVCNCVSLFSAFRFFARVSRFVVSWFLVVLSVIQFMWVLSAEEMTLREARKSRHLSVVSVAGSWGIPITTILRLRGL